MNDLREMLTNSDEVAKRLSTRGFSLDRHFWMRTRISEKAYTREGRPSK